MDKQIGGAEIDSKTNVGSRLLARMKHEIPQSVIGKQISHLRTVTLVLSFRLGS